MSNVILGAILVILALMWIHGTHTATVTVPEGAAYFSLICVLPHINVQECRMMQFMVRNFEISCLTSALVANSESLGVIQNKIDRVQQDIQNVNNRLDQVEQGIQDTNDKLDDANTKLDDIISGGQAGSDLDNAGDQLDQGKIELDNVMGNLDNASGLLPQMPGNIQDVMGDNMAVLDNTTLATLMPWNDAEYSEFWNAMFTPTLAAVSVALLLYFVFGKARSG